MKTRTRISLNRRSSSLFSGALAFALVGTLPLSSTAQSTSDSQQAPPTSGDMPGMDHAAMPGTPSPQPAAPSKGQPATPKPSMDAQPTAPTSAADNPAPMDHGAMPEMDHSAMPGMDHAAPTSPDAPQGMDHPSTPGMDHGAMKGMDPSSGMTMGPMQGGRAPANARSPDYSEGVDHGPMTGMDMADNASLGMLLIDQLEGFHGSDADGQTWEAEGWYGNDVNKLWLRTQGERSRGTLKDADLEVFWNRNIATFWSRQLGVRHDFGEGPSRTWAAFGVQGIAPYWFQVEASGYVGNAGRTAARLRAEYELLITQRLILQPEFEVNLYGKDDPARRIGRGLSDAQLGLRLRYEFRRQFAPYIGVNWIRRIGTTADYAREDHQRLLDWQVVAGVRLWF